MAASNTADQSKLESIIEITNLERDNAWRLLRKHGGDIDRAVIAYFDGDKGDEPPLTQDPAPFWNDPSSQAVRVDDAQKARRAAPTPTQDVIDLTGDEDAELKKALEISMHTSTETVLFGPSERAPDPAWAMVRSNVETSTLSQDEQSLSRAIEASLHSSYQDFAEAEVPPLPTEHLLRKDSRPITVRPSVPGLCYAGLALHALFFVPQVRDALVHWVPETASLDDSVRSPEDEAAWSTLNAFGYLALSVINGLEMDDILQRAGARPATRPDEPVGDLTSQFLEQLARSIEAVLGRQVVPHVRAERYGSFEHLFLRPFVRVHAGSAPAVADATDGGGDDLLSALFAALGTQPARLPAPKEVVLIQLAAAAPTHDTSPKERKRFTYPTRMYIDPFLSECESLTTGCRARRVAALEGIAALEARKKEITRFEGRDSVGELRASVHYFENVAHARGSPWRGPALERTAAQLKQALTLVEAELEEIETRIKQMKTDIATIFDIPDLQRYQYELRAVLVHDGLFGRTHLYSYVRQDDKWWKVVDYLVTEVSEETVLTDPAGLHLGAGPYMLMYSRSMSAGELADLNNPEHLGVAHRVKEENEQFLRQIGAEAASQAYVLYKQHAPNAPIGTPPPTRVLSPGALNASAGAPMDLM